MHTYSSGIVFPPKSKQRYCAMSNMQRGIKREVFLCLTRQSIVQQRPASTASGRIDSVQAVRSYTLSSISKQTLTRKASMQAE